VTETNTESNSDWKKGYQSIQKRQFKDMAEQQPEQSADWQKGYAAARRTLDAELGKSKSTSASGASSGIIGELPPGRADVERSSYASTVALRAARAIAEGRIPADAAKEYNGVKDKDAYFAGMKAGNAGWAMEQFGKFDHAIKNSGASSAEIKTYRLINELHRDNTLASISAIHDKRTEPAHDRNKGKQDFQQLLKSGADPAILGKFLKDRKADLAKPDAYLTGAREAVVEHVKKAGHTKSAPAQSASNNGYTKVAGAGASI
jgi:hypothetical protein